MADQANVDQDSLISQFVSITGADEEIAKNTLEAFNWDLGDAINIFVDSNLSASSASTSTNHNHPAVENTVEPIVEVDEVRAPIPPVRQVLVDDYAGPNYAFRGNRPLEAFRDFERETRWQEQQMIEEIENPGSSSSNQSNRNKTFDDLFRPPLDLLFRGSFEMAKFEGQRLNKWLMVNIQNSKEFACQVLNRDVWSNIAIKSIIKEQFIFWQSYSDTNEGQNYMNFYKVAFPYVAIIDPRTGELVVSWNKIETLTFCEKLTQFLHDHPNPIAKDLQSFPKQNHVTEAETLYDASEEMQLKAAIEQSLKDLKDSDDNSNDSSVQLIDEQPKLEDWKDYLGSDDSPKIEIVIRYPDGNRENVIFPSTSMMKALFLFVVNKGYNIAEYDLITNFPKKNLSKCPESMTIEGAGLHSRDTLYVQMKH